MPESACRAKKQSKENQVCRNGRQIQKASLTVECAGVLPLFFMACLSLIIVMNAIRVQTEKNLKLSNQARQIASVASVGDGMLDGIWVDLINSYKLEIPFPVLGLPKLKVALRARVYPYIGRRGSIASAVDTNSGDEMVFVTEYMSVYHTHADCSHIDLTILKTDLLSVREMRNAYGGRYQPCSHFPPDHSGPVYVTATGEYYYPSPEAGSLTRHVRMVKRSACGNLKKCERCAARDEWEAANGS